MHPSQANSNPFSLAEVGRSALALVRSPRELLRTMNREGGYAEPILYALLWQYVANAIGFALSFVGPSLVPLGLGGRILWFLFLPLLSILAGFLFSAFFFIVWHLLGSPHRYETAFRIWALLMPLSAVSALLRPVPFLGLVVMAFYVVLLVLATVEVHEIRPSKAWTVWSILFLLFLIAQVAAQFLKTTGARLPIPQ